MTTYTYDKGGRLASVTDPRTRTTQYIYDELARLKEVLYFDGTKSSLTYDPLGRVQTETNGVAEDGYDFPKFRTSLRGSSDSFIPAFSNTHFFEPQRHQGK